PAALAASLGSAAVALAAGSADCAGAGAVASWDRAPDGAFRPRAFFLAFRDDLPAAAAALLPSLPGWDAAAVAAALPFPAGPPRSLGVALDAPDTWTVYYKPAADRTPVASLEPTARFRAGAVEVGLFLEPTERAERAYARTARHALS